MRPPKWAKIDIVSTVQLGLSTAVSALLCVCEAQTIRIRSVNPRRKRAKKSRKIMRKEHVSWLFWTDPDTTAKTSRSAKTLEKADTCDQNLERTCAIHEGVDRNLIPSTSLRGSTTHWAFSHECQIKMNSTQFDCSTSLSLHPKSIQHVSESKIQCKLHTFLFNYNLKVYFASSPFLFRGLLWTRENRTRYPWLSQIGKRLDKYLNPSSNHPVLSRC